jgi:hypothetical protein
MTHPVDATAYLKHANTLQAEAYAEMCAPDVQPTISPRLPMTEEDLPSYPDHCWHWTSLEKQVLLDWGNKLTAPTPDRQPVIAPVQSREEWWAIREAHFNVAARAYFRVRPQLDNAVIRRVFHIGHCKGYDAAPQPVIAPVLKLTHKMIDAAYRKVWSTVAHRERLAAFAYEIEAAITGRKQ